MYRALKIIAECWITSCISQYVVRELKSIALPNVWSLRSSIDFTVFFKIVLASILWLWGTDDVCNMEPLHEIMLTNLLSS